MLWRVCVITASYQAGTFLIRLTIIHNGLGLSTKSVDKCVDRIVDSTPEAIKISYLSWIGY